MTVQQLLKIDLSPGDGGDPYIAMLGADGRSVSTRDKLFRVTDTIIGSHAFSTRSTPFATTTTVDIGNCHADATMVFGFAKITAPASEYYHGVPADGRWFNVGGSYVHLAHSILGPPKYRAMSVYTFYATGGDVFLEEQIAVEEYRNELNQVFPYPGFTINYELWVGAFV